MTTVGELNEDFRDFLLALVAEGVEFVIVGAYALALHGVPRSTGDIDVFVRLERRKRGPRLAVARALRCAGRRGRSCTR